MKYFSHMVGKVYGRLTVIEILPTNGGNRKVVAKCECGNIKEFQLTKLRIGVTTSCGCYAKELSSLRNSTHGGSQNNKLYNVWNSMKTRCLNKNRKVYYRYGGRGISICDSWINDFGAFSKWAKDNGYSEGLQIDRIENDGNYEPSNCRFVTAKINNNNTSKNRIIQFNGMSKTLAQWSDFIGIKYNTLHERLRHGWEIEKALSTQNSRLIFKQ